MTAKKMLILFLCSIDFNYQGHYEAYIMLLFVECLLFYSQSAKILDNIFCVMPGHLFPVP